MEESREKRDLIIQACIEAIPHIGGPLSTLYFGAKQEKRFKRLEAFYQDVKEEIQKLQETSLNIEDHDRDELGIIIEQLNNKVEEEILKEKICHLKNFLINTLKNTLESNFDQKKYFLSTLTSMSLLECEIMAFLFKHQQPISIRKIQKSGVSQYAIFGAINKIRSYGYLESRRGNFQMNGQQDEHLEDLVFLSDFGELFYKHFKID